MFLFTESIYFGESVGVLFTGEIDTFYEVDGDLLTEGDFNYETEGITEECYSEEMIYADDGSGGDISGFIIGMSDQSTEPDRAIELKELREDDEEPRVPGV